MKNKSSHSKDLINILTVGFALFATFFGAGNLIFPPLLGEQTGPQWWLGFIAFLLADAGLALIAVLSMINREGGLEDQLMRLGKWPARVLCVVLMLCVGPLVVIPRTAATTFEMSIRPLFGNVSPWLFSLLFFAVVAVLTIKPAAVVDIVGKFLTPVLLLTLLFLCVKGIVSPLGPVVQPSVKVSAVRIGVLYGYQTMDSLVGIPVAVIVIKSVREKGYKEKRSVARIVSFASLTAFIGLFLIYGGLTYLGATASGFGLEHLSGTELVVEITRRLLQDAGIIILAAVVFLACLTTAIGMTSAAADYFGGLLHGKLPYSALVLIFCAAGVLLSNLGTTQIIALAGPVLTLIYPIFLTQILLSFFSGRIRAPQIFIGAAIGAALFTVPQILNDYQIVSLPFTERVPLAASGLGWLLPAILGGLAGWLISPPEDLNRGPSAGQNPLTRRYSCIF